MKTGLVLIMEERTRQIESEGWSAEHDDQHKSGELAQAAACYCMTELVNNTYKSPFTFAAIMQVWPFARTWWKPTPQNRVRELVKAGALIAAEIDRLNRAAGG